MKSANQRRLRVSSETIRVLSGRGLRAVIGGVSVEPTTVASDDACLKTTTDCSVDVCYPTIGHQSETKRSTCPDPTL